MIAGPTAGGKSSLAVAVAHELGRRGLHSEIITADSMQVFRGMDIGTAKPTAAERAGVPHHLIDVVEPTERFSVDAWLGLGERAIEEVRGRGGIPIVVGGTHLYIKALLEGLFEGPEPDERLRCALTGMDAGARRAELERVDPAAAARIHVNDVRRAVRALEVFRLTGRPISAHQGQWESGRTRADCVLMGLEWEAEALNKRINSRVRGMVEQGLVEEAWELWRAGRLGPQAVESLGYKQLVEVFERGARHGDEHFPGRDAPVVLEAVERIKIETRRFAKNQRTWLKRLRVTPGSVWLPMGTIGLEEAVARVMGAMGERSPG
ncbi:MAG: tRNA (adenosine(37)-N6)-dimethylallyltransferase MiaA [Phycisphaerales bacterium]|nr:tRNA (adenosine(37)-N6)-dimethylallyltransferase MiaA [Phycisphaerales bacterium]